MDTQTIAGATPAKVSVSQKDWWAILIVGAGVGLLVQPILTNILPGSGIEPSMLVRLSVLLFFLVIAPIALYVASLAARVLPPLYQFAKFGAVGALNTFVDLGVLNLEIYALGASDGAYPIYKSVSFVLATLNSYFWNKHWTFQSRKATTFGQTMRFYVVTIIGFAVNIGIATLVVTLAGSASAGWANIGALTGIVLSLIVNFIGYKFFVFKE